MKWSVPIRRKALALHLRKFRDIHLADEEGLDVT
jgi:hypothetical protein